LFVAAIDPVMRRVVSIAFVAVNTSLLVSTRVTRD
jgi:hypothetical protein